MQALPSRGKAGHIPLHRDPTERTRAVFKADARPALLVCRYHQVIGKTTEMKGEGAVSAEREPPGDLVIFFAGKADGKLFLDPRLQKDHGEHLTEFSPHRPTRAVAWLSREPGHLLPRCPGCICVFPCPFKAEGSTHAGETVKNNQHFPWVLICSGSGAADNVTIVLADPALRRHREPDVGARTAVRVERREKITGEHGGCCRLGEFANEMERGQKTGFDPNYNNGTATINKENYREMENFHRWVRECHSFERFRHSTIVGTSKYINYCSSNQFRYKLLEKARVLILSKLMLLMKMRFLSNECGYVLLPNKKIAIKINSFS